MLLLGLETIRSMIFWLRQDIHSPRIPALTSVPLAKILYPTIIFINNYITFIFLPFHQNLPENLRAHPEKLYLRPLATLGRQHLEKRNGFLEEPIVPNSDHILHPKNLHVDRRKLAHMYVCIWSRLYIHYHKQWKHKNILDHWHNSNEIGYR